MQILINISEESYKNIKEQVDKRDYPDMQIGRAIADGVLIPEKNNNTRLRVYFLILGAKIWTKEVSSPEEARSIIDTIANFVNFQVDNHVFPDHCSTAGLEMWDEDNEEWVDWYDNEGLDFESHFEEMELELDEESEEI